MSGGRASRFSPIALSCRAKSGNSPSCGGGSLGHQDVPGEHRAEVLAVQAHRTRGVTGRVDDLERDVRDLEDAAVFHLDIGVLAGMGLPPQRAVPRVQGHRRLVPFGHLERGGDVVGVAVRADDREHLAVAHRVEQARGVGARIDDDDLLVVADDPRVDVAGPRRELIDPSAHGPFLPQSGAWSGQGDQAGLGGGEPAGAVVETAQVVLEVHVQVLAARGLGAGPGVPDQFGANALAAGLDRRP